MPKPKKQAQKTKKQAQQKPKKQAAATEVAPKPVAEDEEESLQSLPMELGEEQERRSSEAETVSQTEQEAQPMDEGSQPPILESPLSPMVVSQESPGKERISNQPVPADAEPPVVDEQEAGPSGAGRVVTRRLRSSNVQKSTTSTQTSNKKKPSLSPPSSTTPRPAVVPSVVGQQQPPLPPKQQQQQQANKLPTQANPPVLSPSRRELLTESPVVSRARREMLAEAPPPRKPDPLRNAEITIYNFHPGRCNVCLIEYGSANFPRYPTPLLLCVGCRLVVYCGPVHQRADWKYHKYVCRAIKSMNERYGLPYVYNIRGSFRYSSLKSMNETKDMIWRNLLVELDREPTDIEKQMVFFPKQCAICYQHEPRLLVPCKMCESVWFCNEEPHRDEQCLLVHPEKTCEQMKLLYSMVIVGQQRTIGPPDSLKSQPDESFPKDLFTLIYASTRVFYTSTPKQEVEYVNFAAVCNFSYVATLVSAIRQAQLIKKAQKRFLVHVVGVQQEMTLFSYHECWLLFRWLPDEIEEIIIDFIGPAMPDNLTDAIEHKYADQKCVIRFHQSLYEKLSTDFGNPDICMCYNSGFCEQPDANPWIPALERMIATSACIAFTSYIRVESQHDLDLLVKMAEQRKANPLVWQRWLTRNDYRDLRPYRNSHMEAADREEIYYCNGYLNVMTLNRDGKPLGDQKPTTSRVDEIRLSDIISRAKKLKDATASSSS